MCLPGDTCREYCCSNSRHSENSLCHLKDIIWSSSIPWGSFFYLYDTKDNFFSSFLSRWLMLGRMLCYTSCSLDISTVVGLGARFGWCGFENRGCWSHLWAEGNTFSRWGLCFFCNVVDLMVYISSVLSGQKKQWGQSIGTDKSRGN